MIDPKIPSVDNADLSPFLTGDGSRQVSIAELFQLAEKLGEVGQRARAIEVYKAWIAFNPEHPLLHLAIFNCAVAASQQGDVTGAIVALRACLNLRQDFGPAHINLGRALEDCGLPLQAVQQWQGFIGATSDISADRIAWRAMTLKHIGRVLEGAGLAEEAEAALWQAMELQPGQIDAGMHWTALRLRQCKWPVLSPSEHVSARQLIDAMSPLTLGCFADDPMFQLAKAHRYNKWLVGRPNLTDFPRQEPRRKCGMAARLRIGYVSSDLRDHAVGFALSEVLELHDGETIEVYAYYCGEPRSGDPTQARIKAAVHCWRDLSTVSDADAAAQIRADAVDILVDVNGYTKHARTGIFARRPAPVIVNFCGYPGSMGSPFHHYIVGDEHVIPPGSEIYYSEQVLRVACVQPVDRKRLIAERPERAAAGLPAKGFVYACFNGLQKITASCFDRWMTILSSVPDSVLWLLSENEAVHERLRQEARSRGIEPHRLVFAPKLANADHLARVGLADLFLDTFPYGAHSTAADAVTVGLPVLTIAGKAFAARFCASILSAAGIPELVCGSPQAYVDRAISLAHHPDELATIRQSLIDQKPGSVLRDIPGRVRQLESLFWDIQGNAEGGRTPIPDLRNLDIYYEIGAEIAQQNLEELTATPAYRERYRELLARWNDFEPIAQDARLLDPVGCLAAADLCADGR